MTNAQKIRLRLSQVRQRLNEVEAGQFVGAVVTLGYNPPRKPTASAPEGYHNQSEATLTLPSDCPTK